MHEHGGFFQDPQVWVAIAFVVFFILFGKKIWNALTAMMDQHAATVRGELAEAQRLRQEAEAMLKDASHRREAAILDAKRMIDGAQAEAAQVTAAAATEAEASAARRERMALDRIAAAEKAAVDDVRIAAADIAAKAAEQVIRESLSPEGSAALIDRAISGLTTALAPKRAA